MARRPSPPTGQSFHYPAPIGGLNTVSAGMAMPMTDCVSAINLLSGENGLRTRQGYREWVTNLTGNTTTEVRTIMAYDGSSPSSSRAFATTETGIWNVTSTGTSPSISFSFASNVGYAGHGVAVNFVTTAGHFLLYTDEMNGYHVYTETGGAWTKVTSGAGATQINGVDPTQLAFVAIFKNRVWFVQKDTSDAWYLPVGQIYGTATKFPMGTVLRSGGSIVGLWNWTYDGGSGLDDSLVAVSSTGDVAVWQGTDPASATSFGLRGVWQIGPTPEGRRIGSTFGGDLLLLSRQGLVPMSKLVVGGGGTSEYATAKIANLVNTIMARKSNYREWGVLLHPEDNALVVLVPRGTDDTHMQLAQSSASRGWFTYSGVPMLSAGVWDGKLLFGTYDGRVCVNTGDVDAVLLSDLSAYQSVEWSILGAFSNFGSPRQKLVHMMRPLITSDGALPTVEVAARFDYDQTEIDAVTLVLASGANSWDTATWDVSVWGGDEAPSYTSRGTSGMGVNVGVAIRGTSVARTVLVGIDVLFSQGGFL